MHNAAGTVSCSSSWREFVPIRYCPGLFESRTPDYGSKPKSSTKLVLRQPLRRKQSYRGFGQRPLHLRGSERGESYLREGVRVENSNTRNPAEGMIDA